MGERVRGVANGRTRSMTTLLGNKRDWARDFGVATAVGLFLGLAGPFGNYLNGSLPVRLAYWLGSVWTGVLVLGLLFRLALRAARRWGANPIFAVIFATPAAAVPIAAVCRAAAVKLWPGPVETVSLAEWYGQTLLVCAPFAFAAWMLSRPRRQASGPRDAPAASRPESQNPAGGFLARLPGDLGRELLALQMEDHYVRAHTGNGSTLVLIPLHRAIGELAGIPGLKVHRSWWVAHKAVVGCVRDGRNVRLRLSNGLEAPVARASIAAVKARGLPGAEQI